MLILKPCKRWKISGMTLFRLRKSGKLTSYKLGERVVRFAIAEVIAYEQQAFI